MTNAAVATALMLDLMTLLTPTNQLPNKPFGDISCLVMSCGTNMWNPTPQVYFSPDYGGGNCASNIVDEVNRAKKTIYMEAYQFTLPDLAGALIKAKQRGVDVRMIVDKTITNSKNEMVSLCASNGIPVQVDKKHNIFHSKMMLIDGQTVITGSYNFTVNASKRNAENLWVIIDKNAAELCISNWMIHSSHSIPFKE